MYIGWGSLPELWIKPTMSNFFAFRNSFLLFRFESKPGHVLHFPAAPKAIYISQSATFLFGQKRSELSYPFFIYVRMSDVCVCTSKFSKTSAVYTFHTHNKQQQAKIKLCFLFSLFCLRLDPIWVICCLFILFIFSIVIAAVVLLVCACILNSRLSYHPMDFH